MVNSVQLNGVNVKWKNGFAIRDFLNQDLNTGILVIPHTNKIEIEPFDIIRIQYETTKFISMYVATITSKVVKFAEYENDYEWTYEIGLVSLTTKLQRIVLPNRSITNSIDGTADFTIKEKIEQYLEMYAPDISLSSTLINRLGTTPVPEQQWNRPTLFEVLNDLLKPIGCVVTMIDESTISYLDLDEDGNAINQQTLNGIEYSQDIREYADELEIDASNVYDRNAIIRTPEFYVPKTTEQGLMTDQNQEIILNKPIFELEKVVVRFYYPDQFIVNYFHYYDLDITSRVVNKTVWDTFWSSKSAAPVPDTLSKKYQRNYLYFEEGDNKIKGLNFREDDWLPGFNVTDKALTNVIFYRLQEINTDESIWISQHIISDQTFNTLLYRTIGFDVEYRSTENILFKVRKDIPLKHSSTLISSQQNSLINIDTFGQQQQEFVNRTGNPEMSITGRYSNYNDIPNLNDFINEFILTEREIQFHQNFYNFNGKLTKHYSKDNLFEGINTAKRYTSISSPSEASVSNHLTEVDMIFSNYNFQNNINYDITEDYLVETLGDPTKRIQGAVVVTDEMDTGLTGNKILLETSSHKVGKSFIVTMNMSDNYNTYLKLEDTADFISQKLMRNVPYVDDNGRFEEIKIELYRDDLNHLNRGISFESLYTEDGALYNFEQGMTLLELLPSLKETGSKSTDGTPESVTNYNTINQNSRIFFSGTHLNNFVKRYKDNREITYETIQFFFSTEVNQGSGYSTQEIFITDKIIDFMAPIIKIPKSIRVAYSTSEKYKIGDKVYRGTILPSTATDIEKVNNKIEIKATQQVTTWDLVKNSIISYALCDNNGNILVSVNKNGDYEPLYLNRKL